MIYRYYKGTFRLRPSLAEKILITESGARRSSKWENL